MLYGLRTRRNILRMKFKATNIPIIARIYSFIPVVTTNKTAQTIAA